MLATFVLTLIFIAIALGLLLWVKTPYYRIDTCNVIALLELVVTGQATDSDWSVFSAVPIPSNPQLEAIRLQCLDIEEREYIGDVNAPYLFTSAGIVELRQILDELQNSDNSLNDRSV